MKDTCISRRQQNINYFVSSIHIVVVKRHHLSKASIVERLMRVLLFSKFSLKKLIAKSGTRPKNFNNTNFKVIVHNQPLEYQNMMTCIDVNKLLVLQHNDKAVFSLL